MIEVLRFWVDHPEITRELPLAVIAAEDQKFPNCFGFDISVIDEALEHNINDRSTRAASTITQQVKKNLLQD